MNRFLVAAALSMVSMASLAGTPTPEIDTGGTALALALAAGLIALVKEKKAKK